MHIDLHLSRRRAQAHTNTRGRNSTLSESSGMKKPDDAWLLIIWLCMKIDWVPYEREKLLEALVSSFVFSCFNWTTWLCHFVKWRSHRLSPCLQRWINGCFYSNCCLRAHCHQRNYQCFCRHHCYFHHHRYHCYYRCYRHYFHHYRRYIIFMSSSGPWSLAILVPVIIQSLLLLSILPSFTPAPSAAGVILELITSDEDNVLSLLRQRQIITDVRWSDRAGSHLITTKKKNKNQWVLISVVWPFYGVNYLFHRSTAVE